MTFKVETLEKETEVTPYTPGVTLVARAAGDLLSEPRSHDGSSVNDDFIRYAANLLRQARRVALWWTPARVEQEALRRAGDEVEPSVIAREHHLFLAVYLTWDDLFVNWASSVEIIYSNVPDFTQKQEQLLVRRGHLLRGAVRDVLEVLERKAATAETRAMDIRLRIDHQRLSAIIAGHNLVSKLIQLVELAEKNLNSQDHLRDLAQQLLPMVRDAERSLGSIESAADFTYDKLLLQEAHAAGAMKRVVGALATAAFSSGTKVFLEQLLRHFT